MTAEIKEERVDEVKRLLEEGSTAALSGLLARLHPSDVGRILSGLKEEDATSCFKLLGSELASSVLLEVDEHMRKTLLAELPSTRLIEIVEEMETDDATDIVSELTPEEAEEVLEGLGRKESMEVQKLLAYPEDTAGGKMQTELVSVHEDETVERTIEEVRRRSQEIENISNVFVVDPERRLTGVIPLDKLILARPSARIGDICDRNPHRATTDMDQEQVARIFQRYDLLTLPVVDDGGRLVGRITVDDVVDVIEEEIFEDFYRMAGLMKEERVLDPMMRSVWMRFPWLLVNLGTAFLAASVVKVFQGTIEKLVLLAVLMPIVAGMGGNAGTQTITVVVRGLALGEFELKNAKRVLIKEAAVGLSNGFLIGIVATVVAYVLWAKPVVGLLLFLAMTANLMIAGLSGALIPLLLKWSRVDPAISSSIFVTTCTDIGGFFTFLGLATVFMRMGIL